MRVNVINCEVPNFIWPWSGETLGKLWAHDDDDNWNQTIIILNISIIFQTCTNIIPNTP